MTYKNSSIDKIIDDVVKQLICYFKYCEFEYKEVINLKKKVNNACNIVIEAYKNKQLTKKEFINKMIQIKKIQFSSEVFTKFTECSLKNCYSINEKLLDDILEKLDKFYNIKYKKPAKYTVNEYKKIMMIYIKKREIMRIANSHEIKKKLN
jgi:hypothetical protein